MILAILIINVFQSITLHNGASNEIKEIEVWKKCPKVKPYCSPIFDPIMFKPFFADAKLPKFCAKCFSLSKESNIGCIFWICLWKIMNGWSDKLETWHTETLDPALKKAWKQQFYPGSRSWCKYFPNIFFTIFIKKFLKYLELALGFFDTNDLGKALWKQPISLG